MPRSRVASPKTPYTSVPVDEPSVSTLSQEPRPHQLQSPTLLSPAGSPTASSASSRMDEKLASPDSVASSKRVQTWTHVVLNNDQDNISSIRPPPITTTTDRTMTAPRTTSLSSSSQLSPRHHTFIRLTGIPTACDPSTIDTVVIHSVNAVSTAATVHSSLPKLSPTSASTFLIDMIDGDNEDPFTLESFASLIRISAEREKDFIIARVTTVDPSKENHFFYSYYAAHHINKILFRTQPEEGLLHRMKTKNPLNNMTIVGDVHYYIVTPKGYYDVVNKLLTPSPSSASSIGSTRSTGLFATKGSLAATNQPANTIGNGRLHGPMTIAERVRGLFSSTVDDGRGGVAGLDVDNDGKHHHDHSQRKKLHLVMSQPKVYLETASIPPNDNENHKIPSPPLINLYPSDTDSTLNNPIDPESNRVGDTQLFDSKKRGHARRPTADDVYFYIAKSNTTRATKSGNDINKSDERVQVISQRNLARTESDTDVNSLHPSKINIPNSFTEFDDLISIRKQGHNRSKSSVYNNQPSKHIYTSSTKSINDNGPWGWASNLFGSNAVHSEKELTIVPSSQTIAKGRKVEVHSVSYNNEFANAPLSVENWIALHCDEDMVGLIESNNDMKLNDQDTPTSATTTSLNNTNMTITKRRKGVDKNNIRGKTPAQPIIFDATFFATDDDYLMKSAIRHHFKTQAVEEDDAVLFSIPASTVIGLHTGGEGDELTGRGFGQHPVLAGFHYFMNDGETDDHERTGGRRGRRQCRGSNPRIKYIVLLYIVAGALVIKYAVPENLVYLVGFVLVFALSFVLVFYVEYEF